MPRSRFLPLLPLLLLLAPTTTTNAATVRRLDGNIERHEKVDCDDEFSTCQGCVSSGCKWSDRSCHKTCLSNGPCYAQSDYLGLTSAEICMIDKATSQDHGMCREANGSCEECTQTRTHLGGSCFWHGNGVCSNNEIEENPGEVFAETFITRGLDYCPSCYFDATDCHSCLALEECRWRGDYCWSDCKGMDGNKCYSPNVFGLQYMKVADICTIDSNMITCQKQSGNGCQACADTVLSNGATCYYNAQDDECSSLPCDDISCGTPTCDSSEVEDICNGNNQNCVACLSSGCAYAIDGNCNQQCPPGSPFCYRLEPAQEVTQVCKQLAGMDQAALARCASNEDCVSCTSTVKADGTSNCQWLEYVTPGSESVFQCRSSDACVAEGLCQPVGTCNEQDEDKDHEEVEEEVGMNAPSVESEAEVPDEESEGVATSIITPMPEETIIMPEKDNNTTTGAITSGEFFYVALEPFSLSMDAALNEEDLQLESYLLNYMQIFMPNLIDIALTSERDLGGSVIEGNATFEGMPARSPEEANTALIYALEDGSALQAHFLKATLPQSDVTLLDTPSDLIPVDRVVAGIEAETEESNEEEEEEEGLSTAGLSLIIVVACVLGFILFIFCVRGILLMIFKTLAGPIGEGGLEDNFLEGSVKDGPPSGSRGHERLDVNSGIRG